MLNLIPALILFLASGPFGHLACDSMSLPESNLTISTRAQFAQQWCLAGLPLSEYALVAKKLDSHQEPRVIESSDQELIAESDSFELWSFFQSQKSRDGPVFGSQFALPSL